MTIFRVGSEVGGREAGSALKFAQISMNNVFFFNPDLGSYFRTIKFFALAFRVSGKAKDFNGEGPELKKPRGKNFYAVDFTIPEVRWNGIPFDDLRRYVVDGVRQCFELCVAKAKKSGELLDERKLRFDFEAGIQEILDADENNDLFHKSKGLDILKSMIIETELAGQHVDKLALMKKMRGGIFTA